VAKVTQGDCVKTQRKAFNSLVTLVAWYLWLQHNN
jgi:hypothetical protein